MAGPWDLRAQFRSLMGVPDTVWYGAQGVLSYFWPVSRSEGPSWSQDRVWLAVETAHSPGCRMVVFFLLVSAPDGGEASAGLLLGRAMSGQGVWPSDGVGACLEVAMGSGSFKAACLLMVGIVSHHC